MNIEDPALEPALLLDLGLQPKTKRCDIDKHTIPKSAKHCRFCKKTDARREAHLAKKLGVTLSALEETQLEALRQQSLGTMPAVQEWEIEGYVIQRFKIRVTAKDQRTAEDKAVQDPAAALKGVTAVDRVHITRGPRLIQAVGEST